MFAGRTVLHIRRRRAIGAGTVGWRRYSASFAPDRPGMYVFAGTVFVGDRHQHKAVTFMVAG